MAELVCTDGPLVGESLMLNPEAPMVFGRDPAGEGAVAVPDNIMSSSHAELAYLDGMWTIRDLESSNGTFVNGIPATYQQLAPGDNIVMGESVFRYDEGAIAEAVAEEFVAEEIVAEEAVAEEVVAEEIVAEEVVAEEVVAEEIVAEEVVAEEVVAKEAVAEKKKPEPKKEDTPPQGTTEEDVQRVLQMKEKTDAIRAEVGKVIVGQLDIIEQVLMCMVAGGHGLLIGLPGMAKTLLVSTIAKVLDMEYKRIQFTPDLMPTDITGTEILSTDQVTGEKEFRFVKGPIFCNLLLADEINRTPPKTQAALLEAMQEKRVTAGNTTYVLDPPFFVLATQNPVEQEGTYPLPEAQLDRFMFNIWVDYPGKEEEQQIVGSTTSSGGLKEPQSILTKYDVIELQRIVRQIPVSEHVVRYAIDLVRATRPANEEAPEVTKKYISCGAGPRAGQYLVLGGKSGAALEGRIHVSCADIRRAAIPVLRHRIMTNFSADSEGLTSMDIVRKLIDDVPEPDENAYQPTE